MKTMIQIAFGSYQWMLIYVGREKMVLRRPLLQLYRKVVHRILCVLNNYVKENYSFLPQLS